MNLSVVTQGSCWKLQGVGRSAASEGPVLCIAPVVAVVRTWHVSERLRSRGHGFKSFPGVHFRHFCSDCKSGWTCQTQKTLHGYELVRHVSDELCRGWVDL